MYAEFEFDRTEIICNSDRLDETIKNIEILLNEMRKTKGVLLIGNNKNFTLEQVEITEKILKGIKKRVKIKL